MHQSGQRNNGNYAFFQCTNLTSVMMGANIATIWNSAFAGCIRLTSITIPRSVTRIGNAAFRSCNNLNITVDKNNPAYSSVDGVIFNKSRTALIQYPGGKTGHYRIPNSVTNIGDFAFAYSAGLTNVTIPTSVTSIGNEAFAGTRLTDIEIPKSVTSIGAAAFFGCRRLTAVYFQGNAPIIGANAFGTARFDAPATVYYLPGTTNWSATFGGRPTALWVPQAQTNKSNYGIQTNTSRSLK